MCGKLIFKIFNLIKLFQYSWDEESVGEESHKHKSDEIDRLVHTSNITQQSNYWIDLSRVNVVEAIISYIDRCYVPVLDINLIIIKTTVFDFYEFYFFLLSELYIVILEWYKGFL